ncbi:MAG: protein kinase [Isosphaeraceae bacterium]
MSGTGPNHDSRHDETMPDVPAELQPVCGRFEAAWHAALHAGGPTPQLDRFVQELPASLRALGDAALKRLDQGYRAQLAVRGAATEYDPKYGPARRPPDTGGSGTTLEGASPAPTLPGDHSAPTLPAMPGRSGEAGMSDDFLVSDDLAGSGFMPAPTMPATGMGGLTDEWQGSASGFGPPPTVRDRSEAARDASGETTDFDPPSRPDDATVAAPPGGQTRTRPDDGRPSVPRTPRPSTGRGSWPRVPGYEIVGELGRGGMGVVYKARQVRLRRLVALKMVLSGAHASADQLERFQTEARSVAQLKHPGIVEIYEISEHDGLPYFSLEFVEGGSLAHLLEGKPQTPVVAARTVEQLARAMATAHDRKILHRDLKPANVLMTPDGQPKITDFGLAKELDTDSQQTRTGAIMGTPSYMSPEQAKGENAEIGPHSDQYALGAILYEMLTGRPPFQAAHALETLELVRSQEPVPPTRLQPRIPIDVETICLKALHKESAKRYESCAAMADDLQRFLNNEPIVARPVSRAERAIRWCKRNPKVAALSAASILLTLALITGLGVAAALFKAQNDELKLTTKRANDNANTALTNARTAEERRKQANTVADNATKLNFNAIDALRKVNLAASEGLNEVPGAQRIRQEVIGIASDALKSALQVQEELIRVRPDTADPVLLSRTMASVHRNAGLVFQAVGRRQEAIDEFKKMDSIIEDLFKAKPDDDTMKRNLAASKNTLGDFHSRIIGDALGGRDFYLRALALRKDRLAKTPDRDDLKLDVANSLGLVGQAYLDLGDPFKAIDFYKQERETRDTLSPATRRNVEILRQEAGYYEKVGDLRLRINERDQALKDFDRSLEIRRMLLQERPDNFLLHRDLLLAYLKQGEVRLIVQNDPRLALDWYQKALDLAQEIVNKDPQNLPARRTLATAQYTYAATCERLDKTKEARDHFRECLKLRQALVEDQNARANPDARVPLLELMLAKARCGVHEEAARLASGLVEIPPQDSRIYFFAACGFALAAEGVGIDRPDAKRTPAEDTLVKTYTDRAFDTLKKALNAGWRGVHDIELDPDLDPIRKDPRFEPLLAEFRAAAAKAEAEAKVQQERRKPSPPGSAVGNG